MQSNEDMQDVHNSEGVQNMQNNGDVQNAQNSGDVQHDGGAQHDASTQNAALEEIKVEVMQCHACGLCETRTNVVFGVGNPFAEVMFIGEAPGKQEDLGAEPFIGAAGKYLNQLLDIAGLVREDIYIANVLKCRPPSNRDPAVEEIQTCTPFLRRQVAAISPDVLVTLGNFASKFILKTDKGITSLRGKAYTAGRFYVLPTFHPAAAIYDKSKGPLLQSDFALLKELLSVERDRKAKRAATQLGEQNGGL